MESVIVAGKRKKSSQGEEESLALKKNRKKSSDPLNFNLDDVLTDDLLIEVLLRLPTSKSAINCMLVSKRWHSLIHSPSFISQFTSHHTDQEMNKNNTDSYAASFLFRPRIFMTVCRDPRLTWFGTSDKEDDRDENFAHATASFNSEGFTLKFLPEPREIVCIAASCNDILLCGANENKIHHPDTSRLYICNPFTKQWLPLPSPPIRKQTSPYVYCYPFLGLVCEPNYQKWQHLGRAQQLEQIHQSRFRAVLFNPLNKSDSDIHVYCSETGQWYQSPVSTRQYQCCLTNVVAYDSKLHWYNGNDVVAYDPFNNGRTIFLNGGPGFKVTPRLPGDPPPPVRSFCLGVCQGSLRFIQTTFDPHSPATDHISVWELKDYESRSLSFVGKIFFNSMHVDRRLLTCAKRYHNMRAIATHPDNKDVVYLRSMADDLVSCNIQTRQLEFIRSTDYKDGSVAGEKNLLIALPWWPTPVSTPQQNSPLQ